ncbi:hypothetical protein HHI36_004573 [Cryptolaemus montrouzieri]|uniref:Uncharacterized protein n=1 Tax=Cryptolaemus montrouzieri TaxID=559131 RepID=A0ABD2NRK9_9CUCU
MERNTYGESCSLDNDQSSHISLTPKQGLMDITSPLEITAVEIDSWADLQEKILNILNQKARSEDKQLTLLYRNENFSRNSSNTSIVTNEESEDDEMYEEIVNTFNLATQEEAEVVVLPDEKTWKRMWKFFKKILKIRNREHDQPS